MKIMRALMLLTILVLTPAMYATPSFDCRKAKTDIEHAICQDEFLSGYDKALDIIYKQALQSLNNPEKIRGEQIQWVKNRPNFERRIEDILHNLRNQDPEFIKSQRTIFYKSKPENGKTDYEENLISALWGDYHSRMDALLEGEDGKLRSFFLEEFVKNPDKSDKVVSCFAILSLLANIKKTIDLYNSIEDVIKKFRFTRLTSNKVLILLNTSNGAYRETYDFYTISKEADKVNLMPYTFSNHRGPNCDGKGNSLTGNFAIDFDNKVIGYNVRPVSYEGGECKTWKLNENCAELIPD